MGLNPLIVVHGAKVKLLIFFLSIIRGIKWNLIGALALSCPQRGSCRADTASTDGKAGELRPLTFPALLKASKQTNTPLINCRCLNCNE